MNLKSICPVNHCTGCMACVAACSHGAIEITTSPLGFKIPKIKTDSCTNCGLCRSTCPELNRRELKFPRQAWAAVVRNNIKAVASGGAATALCESVIKRGGVAVGCSGENMTDVKHIIIDSIDELPRLQGSKYVQSRLEPDLLRQIRGLLNDGVEVIFIGTGCQVAGLCNFLRKPYQGLTTVDLVCHGVPSQKMLNENMALYPNINPNTIQFRVKIPKPNGEAIRYGWHYNATHTDSGTTQHFIPWQKDPYLAAFMECLSFRDCCYDCRYAYSSRQSDLTICDFWGLQSDCKLNTSLGVSAILVNTRQGKKCLDLAKELMNLEERTVREAITGNGQLMCPSRCNNASRAQFVNLCKKNGFVHAATKVAVPKAKRTMAARSFSRFLQKAYALVRNLH